MELKALEKIASKETLKEITIWEINSAFDLVQIAQKVLKAELLWHEKKYTQSLTLFNEAVAIEDALNYNEPPDWFFSVRHHLGAKQLEAKHYPDAVRTYTQDLKKYPKNGWALKGLSVAYLKLGDLSKQKEAALQFDAAWKTADIPLNSSIIQ